jgi:hypothetical protein
MLEDNKYIIDLNSLSIKRSLERILDYIEEKHPFDLMGNQEKEVVQRLNQAIKATEKSEKPLRKR